MQIKPNCITIFSFFLSMSIGACNCKKDPADGDKNKIHPVVNATTNPPVSNPPTANPPVSNPPTTNPPVSNPPTTNPPVSNPPTTNPPTTNSTITNLPTSNPPTINPPTSNPTSNPTFTSSSSADDSSDSAEDSKSKSAPLPPLQNPPIVVNNSKLAVSNSTMSITNDMIQTLRKPDVFKNLSIFRAAFADRLEEIKNGTVQVGGENDWYVFDGKKRNLITAAIYVQRLDVLKALVELGVDVESITPSSENALNIACRWGSLEAVKFLFTIEKLKSKALNKSGSQGNTNLMAAVKSKNQAIVECVWDETMQLSDGSIFLLTVSQADITGTTPLQQAKADGSQTIVNFLLSKGFTV